MSISCPPMRPDPMPVALAPHPLKIPLRRERRGRERRTGSRGKAWLGSQESCRFDPPAS